MFIILGFGRSGTTWISDIISKITNSLILFEPLHPSVNYNKNLSYIYIKNNNIKLKNHLNLCLNKKIKKPWLLRNYIQYDITKNNIDYNLIQNIYNNCNINGFKSIRLNFAINWLKKTYKNSNIIFLIRNPYAVYSSICKRNFWEYGWPNTYNLWIKQAEKILNDYYPIYTKYLYQDNNTYEQKICIMWSVTNKIAMLNNNILIKKYEDIYLNPFKEIKNIFSNFSININSIHPSYIFSPSITTNKTIHGLKNINLSNFYIDLSKNEINNINKVLFNFDMEYLYENSIIR